ncbi:MAG: hypothetical protein ACHQ51_11830 [Elusimicrobiota bacterium]
MKIELLLASLLLVPVLSHAEADDQDPDQQESQIAPDAVPNAAPNMGPAETSIAPLPELHPDAPTFSGSRKSAARTAATAPAGGVSAPASGPASSAQIPAHQGSAGTPPGYRGGPIGSTWTPEDTGIPLLDDEYAKGEANKKAGVDQCRKNVQNDIAAGKPRAFTGMPTDAQAAPIAAEVNAAHLGDCIYNEYFKEMIACGGTASDIIAAYYQASQLEGSCYMFTTGSHNSLPASQAAAFCGGYDFAPIQKCYRDPYNGMLLLPRTFDPAEALRRSSFGADSVGNIPAPVTAGIPDQNVPGRDYHDVLRTRVEYFDSIKAGLTDEGYDPQLVYYMIMSAPWTSPETAASIQANIMESGQSNGLTGGHAGVPKGRTLQQVLTNNGAYGPR